MEDVEALAIQRLKRGEIAALEMLVKRYQVTAARAAYLITQDSALTDDIVQEAFIKAYHSIDRFDASRPFKPWLMRIVVNDALYAMRRTRRQRIETHGDMEEITALLSSKVALSSEHDPADAVEARELRDKVREALQTLSPDQRAAVVMRYYLGLNEREMAEELDIPTGTVSWRLHAARKQLKSLLRPFVSETRATQEGEA